jgi:predicted dehydrogenase
MTKRKPKATHGRLLAVGGGMGAGLLHHGLPLGYDGAIVDVNAELLRRQCAHFGVPGYASLAEALAAHADYAGAYIATPNRFHAEQAIALAPLGIPVFMEKPLGISRAECDAVLAAWRRSRGWLQLDFEYRFSPIYADAAAILHGGEIGDLRSINLEYTVGPYLPGTGWRLDPKAAGGLFGEKLCHLLDLFRFWSRSEFRTIHVSASPRCMDWYDEATTDNLTADFVMDNGVAAHLLHSHGATALPQDDRNQETDWADFGHRLAVALVATGGALQLDIWKRTLTVVKRDPADGMKPRFARRIDYRHLPFMAIHHDMTGMLKDFVQRVHSGAGPRLPVEDSYRTMLAVFEADRQLRRAARAANRRVRALRT